MKRNTSKSAFKRLTLWGMAALIATLVGCANLPSPTNKTLPTLIPVRDLVADWNGSGNYQISPDGQRLMWGVVDPKRVAISGASYGGYASLMGMTHTPGKFRCAISTVGMSDIAALLDDAPPYWELGKPKWIHYVGNPSDPAQRAAMQERSPLFKAEFVQGPILLMHGVHDPRVRVSQSVQMAQALRANGTSVELVLFSKAGHGFQRWQDNLVAYRKTEDFLSRCLGGRTAGFDFFELGAKLF